MSSERGRSPAPPPRPTSAPQDSPTVPPPATSDEQPLRVRREALVREHMQSENVHDFDTTIGTFGHPRSS
jgi:hypothetical protein